MFVLEFQIHTTESKHDFSGKENPYMQCAAEVKLKTTKNRARLQPFPGHRKHH